MRPIGPAAPRGGRFDQRSGAAPFRVSSAYDDIAPVSGSSVVTSSTCGHSQGTAPRRGCRPLGGRRPGRAHRSVTDRSVVVGPNVSQCLPVADAARIRARTCSRQLCATMNSAPLHGTAALVYHSVAPLEGRLLVAAIVRFLLPSPFPGRLVITGYQALG